MAYNALLKLNKDERGVPLPEYFADRLRIVEITGHRVIRNWFAQYLSMIKH